MGRVKRVFKKINPIENLKKRSGAISLENSQPVVLPVVIDPGYHLKKAMMGQDFLRLRGSEKSFMASTKEARQKRNEARRTLEEEFEAAEEPAYDAGAF
ncbi:hypothetical protein GE061_000178 [Apolygus lucorum]|uniref:Uncharacterized protein n=1 Tax=Apolygus lucorum TaxID=248454 RepID=A0A8S9Y3V4_APOLU|nr:hypothetical protein GE061_000178 [Apolygus lucorum]